MSGHYEVKEGVVLYGLHPRLEAAIPEIALIYKEQTGRRCAITSGRDGSHSVKSLHYWGRAIDVRIHGLTATAVERLHKKLEEALGPDWDVVVEPDHIHIELDWRADK